MNGTVSEEQWWALQKQFVKSAELTEKVIKLNFQLLERIGEQNEEIARLRKLVRQ